MNNSCRTDLLNQLDAIYDAIKKTKTVSKILDIEWYKTIQNEIASFKKEGPFSCDSAIMFFILSPPSLGKSFLAFCDEKLTALSSLQFLEQKILKKFHQLQACRFRLDFRNHLFELLVLGFFAQKGVLTDIEPENTKVDGVIKIDKRHIVIEATFTSQEILYGRPGVYCGDVNAMIKQVTKKLSNKATNGRQIALIEGVPAIVILGLNNLGADHYTSEIAIQECFENPKFSKLSGVIVSDSWKLMEGKFFPALNPEIPLSDIESQTLDKWFS